MARRGRKEGSIFKASDGRWVARVDLGWVGGKRKRKERRCRTRAEASNALDLVRDSVKKGLPVTDDMLTVGRYLNDWPRPPSD